MTQIISNQNHAALLTVSGTIPNDLRDQIDQKSRPYTDYVAMSETFPADLIDYARAEAESGWFGKLLLRLGGPNLNLAWACFKRRDRYKVIFTDGEQIGLPLAFFLKFFSIGNRSRPQHLMIVHILSTGIKQRIIDTFKLHTAIDKFFVYSTLQQKFIAERWSLPLSRVPFTPFMVDHHFFSPEEGVDQPHIDGVTDTNRPYICSVGLEFRDYPTLIEAVKGLDIHVVVAAGSPWSKREDSTEKVTIPANVTVRRFSQYELRKVYAESQFMVMPLYENDFQAGVTALLEAMAMKKAIVCTRTKGQTDVIREGENGLYAPPADPAALRKAIVTLLEQPSMAEEMGMRGRQLIEAEMNLNRYAENLGEFVRKAVEQNAK